MLRFLLLMLIAFAALSAFWMSMKIIPKPVLTFCGAGPPVAILSGIRRTQNLIVARNNRRSTSRKWLSRILRGSSGGIAA